MRRTILTILLITALAAVLIMGGGCMEIPEINTQTTDYNERADGALRYMRDKYGEEFRPVTYDLSEYLSKTDVVECYAPWMDPENEHVSVFVHFDGPLKYGDDYFEYLKRDELEETVSSLLEPELGSKIKVYMGHTHSELPAELTGASTVEDLYEADPGYILWTDVYISDEDNMQPDDFAAKCKSFQDSLAASGRSYVIHMYLVAPFFYDDLSRFDRSSVSEAFNKEWKPDGTVVTNSYNIMIIDGEVE
jgi:hypothetical protein